MVPLAHLFQTKGSAPLCDVQLQMVSLSEEEQILNDMDARGNVKCESHGYTCKPDSGLIGGTRRLTLARTQM
jgi:hypothetical protein